MKKTERTYYSATVLTLMNQQKPTDPLRAILSDLLILSANIAGYGESEPEYSAWQEALLVFSLRVMTLKLLSRTIQDGYLQMCMVQGMYVICCPQSVS
jgi:hypothetical protein